MGEVIEPGAFAGRGWTGAKFMSDYSDEDAKTLAEFQADSVEEARSLNTSRLEAFLFICDVLDELIVYALRKDFQQLREHLQMTKDNFIQDKRPRRVAVFGPGWSDEAILAELFKANRPKDAPA